MNYLPLILLIAQITAGWRFIGYHREYVLLSSLPNMGEIRAAKLDKDGNEIPVEPEEFMQEYRFLQMNAKVHCIFYGALCVLLALGLSLV